MKQLELTYDEASMIHFLIMNHDYFVSERAAQVCCDIEKKLGAKVAETYYAAKDGYHVFVREFPAS